MYKIIFSILCLLIAGCSATQTQTQNNFPATTSIYPPKNLEAVPFSATQIVLVWADYSTNETAFIIERSENESEFKRVKKMPDNSVTYIDKHLESNTKYYYRIKAVNEKSQSQYSNIAMAQTEKG